MCARLSKYAGHVRNVIEACRGQWGNDMEKFISAILYFLPLIFAFGFLVPVIAQGMDALGWHAPFGLSVLSFALIVAGAWGLFAQVKGRWI